MSNDVIFSLQKHLTSITQPNDFVAFCINLVCPASHTKYFAQKGCNYLLRLSPTVRQFIDYNSQRFKEIYNQRTSAERAFSQLSTITMLRPTVIGLQATQNHSTIAHITVLLIALGAHHLGFYNKIRFVKTFLPNLAI